MRRVGVVVLTAGLLVAWGRPEEIVHGSRPAAPILLIAEDFPDPEALKTDAGYFAYSTTSSNGNIPVAEAAAADGPWTVLGDALAAPPTWSKPNGGFWAPDVSARPGGGFLMYFSAVSTATNQMCLAVATASEPAGPFAAVGDGPLVCEIADAGDIDPHTHVAADGSRYLLYKSNGGPAGPPSAIWLQLLSPDGMAVQGPRVELLRADLPAEHGVVEAPVLVQRPDRVVLFYSADQYLSGEYHTSYALAPTLTGPFVKAEAPLLSTSGLGGAVEGPGGAELLEDRIFFHGWLDGGRQARGLYVMPIRFDSDVPIVDVVNG